MLSKIKHALFSKSEAQLKQERRIARRKYDREINTKKQALQDQERSLKARVKAMLSTGDRKQAMQCASQLHRVSRELLHVEKQNDQMAIIDSKADKLAFSEDVSKIIKLDIEKIQLHSQKNGDMALLKDLQEYEAIQAKHSALSELLEDSIDDTIELEEDAPEEIDGILEKMEMELALETQTLVATVPVPTNLETRHEEKELAPDPLMERFENLKRLD